MGCNFIRDVEAMFAPPHDSLNTFHPDRETARLFIEEEGEGWADQRGERVFRISFPGIRGERRLGVERETASHHASVRRCGADAHTRWQTRARARQRSTCSSNARAV